MVFAPYWFLHKSLHLNLYSLHFVCLFVFYLNAFRKISVGTFKKIQNMRYIIILDSNCINLTVEVYLHCIQYNTE